MRKQVENVNALTVVMNRGTEFVATDIEHGDCVTAASDGVAT